MSQYTFGPSETPVVMTGATSSAAGAAGYAPAPAAGDDAKYLKGDGTWDSPSSLPSVSGSDNGKVLQVSNGAWSAEDAISGFYTKPSGGIPASDLASGVVKNPIVPTFEWDDDNNAYVCDMTYAQVYSAIQTGQCTYAEYDGNPYYVTEATQYQVVFTRLEISSENNSACEYYLSSDDSVSYYEIYNNLQNDIAPFERYEISSRAYAIGDIFAFADADEYESNTNLYKATSAIAIGDTIVPGTNCTRTTITDELSLQNTAISNKYTKPSGGIPNSDLATPPAVMTGATSSAAGTSGYVPAPAAGDQDKFLAGDGTFKSGGKPMVILSYGNSTWNDFINAYNSNIIVYCRASSNSNPGTGAQNRLAFMAYVNNSATPTEVEFQYYRSMSSHSATAMGDEVYVYKLTNSNSGTWSVTTRKASIKEIAVESGSKLSVSWSSDKVTLSNTMTASDLLMTGATSSAAGTAGTVPAPAAGDDTKYLKGDGTWATMSSLPAVTSSDNGKSLEVSNGAWATGSKKIDKEYTLPDDWSAKTWSGLTSFYGDSIWTDGENVYYSDETDQYVLDKSTSTWSAKIWSGLTSFYGDAVWTDDENIYYSDSDDQYVLDKSTSTWSAKTWSGLTSFYGEAVWTDGENIYYSSGVDQYVLDKSTSTWSTKTWTGLTSFQKTYIWTDGENIYYSSGEDQYVLDKSTSTWSTKTWTGLTNFDGYYIWTDGENVYYSDSDDQYVLDKSTSTWSSKTWTGLTSFQESYTWTDGENIYYSDDSDHYKLNKSEDQILLGRNGEFTPMSISDFATLLMSKIPSASGVSF